MTADRFDICVKCGEEFVQPYKNSKHDHCPMCWKAFIGQEPKSILTMGHNKGYSLNPHTNAKQQHGIDLEDDYSEESEA